MRGADNRAKILREQATKMAKSQQVKVLIPPEPVKQTSPQGKGISVMVLSLLRRKQPEAKLTTGKSGPTPITKPTSVGGSIRLPNGKSVKPISDSEIVSVNVPSFELNGKSIRALSIRDVLEGQEKQEQRLKNGH